MATTTYKYKSKIATAISFIAAAIVYIGKDELAKIMPPEYAFLASIIVLIAGFILAQSTENKRVEVAEQMIYEKLDQPIDTEEHVLNDEYEVDSDGC